jgi:Trypsin
MRSLNVLAQDVLYNVDSQSGPARQLTMIGNALRQARRCTVKLSSRCPLTIGAVFGCALIGADCARALVGGAPLATQEIARSVVGVVGPRNFFCTATVITRDLLLTAGHCVQPGTSYRAQFKDADGVRQFTDVTTIERPPQFKIGGTGITTKADLGLVKVVQPFPPNIESAAVGLVSPPVWPGDRFLVIGGGIPFRGLHETGINRSAILVATGPYLPLQMLLIDSSGKDIGACSGDSGSPVFEPKNEAAKLIGVVSWSGGPHNTKGCGGLTGATPLAPYRAWIEGTIGQLDSDNK